MINKMFVLNAQLESDSFFIADLKMSRLLLMNDANYPWLVLVPRKENMVELTDLSFDEQTEILKEINLVSHILKENLGAEKLNIATLGNVVSQLHIHVIGRFKDDASFPKPVWGSVPAQPYLEEEKEYIIQKIKSLL